MYERKKRATASARRAGSASYVSRRHFSTICQSPSTPPSPPPLSRRFFFSLSSSFYRALICIVSRRGHTVRSQQTAFVEHSLSPGKMGERDVKRATGSLAAPPYPIYPILSYPMLSYSILSYPVLSYSARIQGNRPGCREQAGERVKRRSERNISKDDVYTLLRGARDPEDKSYSCDEFPAKSRKLTVCFSTLMVTLADGNRTLFVFHRLNTRRVQLNNRSRYYIIIVYIFFFLYFLSFMFYFSVLLRP